MSNQYAGLRAEFLKFRAVRRPGQPYPAGLRERGEAAVVALRARGATWREISRAVGMSLDTARAWWRAHQVRGAAGTALVPVRVQDAPTRPAGGSVTLVSPSGYRVEGAGLEQVVALLRTLG